MSSNIQELQVIDANYLKFKHDKLLFEIRGGINPESYHSLRVMLVTRFDRKTHRDNVDLLNHDSVNAYMRKVTESTSLHREKVKEAFDKLVDQLEEYKLELQQEKNKPTIKSYQLSDADRVQAIELLKQSNLLSHINNMMDEAGLIGNETNRLILFLTYLTRKRNDSLHAVIQSPFNYLQSKLMSMLPEEDIFELSYVSENTLFYFKEDQLQKKVVFVEDMISERKKLKPLISFQQKNQLTKTTVTKNEFAELVAVQKQVKGNISLSISTREEQAFADNGVLSFVIHEDTGKLQDEKVLQYQRKQSAGLISPNQEQKIMTQLHNMQRALNTVSVINPFAMDISLPEQIKNKQISNLHYLRFIEIITYLKQYQRPQKVNEDTGELYIETTLEDIKEANQLLSDILINKSDALNKPTRLFLEQLKSHLAERKTSGEAFVLRDISIALRTPKTSISRYIKTLIETGFVIETGQGDKKNGYQYQLINADEYKELKASVCQAMNSNIIQLEKLSLQTISEPKTTANQNESGALNELKNNPFDEVNHSLYGAIGGSNMKASKTDKKKVA